MEWVAGLESDLKAKELEPALGHCTLMENPLEPVVLRKRTPVPELAQGDCMMA